MHNVVIIDFCICKGGISHTCLKGVLDTLCMLQGLKPTEVFKVMRGSWKTTMASSSWFHLVHTPRKLSLIPQGEPGSRMNPPPKRIQEWKHSIVLKVLEVSWAGFKYQFCHWLAGQPWKSGFPSLSSCFFIYKNDYNNTYSQKVFVKIKRERVSLQTLPSAFILYQWCNHSSHLLLATVTVTFLYMPWQEPLFPGRDKLSCLLERDSVGKQAWPSASWVLTVMCLAMKTVIIFHSKKREEKKASLKPL